MSLVNIYANNFCLEEGQLIILLPTTTTLPFKKKKKKFCICKSILAFVINTDMCGTLNFPLS